MKLLSSFMLVSTAFFSMASSATEDYVDVSAGYQTTKEVFEYGRKSQEIQSLLSNAEYKLQSCKEMPIYYYLPPQEEMFWKSTYVCTYNVPAPQMSFASDYAEISVEVFYNQNILLNHEGQVKVRYWTVY